MRVLFCQPRGKIDAPDGFDLEANRLEVLGFEPLSIATDAIDLDQLESELGRVPRD